jgi:hypothetical protein
MLYFVFCRLYQCCGSGILISDPGSRFLSVPDPDFYPSQIQIFIRSGSHQ